MSFQEQMFSSYSWFYMEYHYAQCLRGKKNVNSGIGNKTEQKVKTEPLKISPPNAFQISEMNKRPCPPKKDSWKMSQQMKYNIEVNFPAGLLVNISQMKWPDIV